MDILHSIILGVVQGISELLPISSSGHLVVIPYIFNWDYKGLDFDIALHFGTAIAIVGFFWRDWVYIIQSGFKIQKSNKNSQLSTQNSALRNYPKNLLWQILVASIPAMIAGLLINDYVESVFHSPLLIAANLAVFGIILWLFDKYSARSSKLEALSYKQSLVVGLAQCVALIPGVSRSGITMTAARGLGLNREQSARFSFLLSTPATVGAFILSVKDLTSNMLNISFILAVLSSAIFGFIAIKYLLQYLRRGSFSVFTVYRIALAAVIVLLYYLR